MNKWSNFMENKNRIYLGDVNKDNIFKVPERYFEELPMTIQNRIQMQHKPAFVPVWTLVLKYAVPVLIFAISVVLWIKSPVQHSPEKLIAQVGESSIMDYLQFSDLSTDDILFKLEDGTHSVLWDDENILDHLQIEDDSYYLFEELGNEALF